MKANTRSAIANKILQFIPKINIPFNSKNRMPIRKEREQYLQEFYFNYISQLKATKLST